MDNPDVALGVMDAANGTDPMLENGRPAARAWVLAKFDLPPGLAAAFDVG